MNKESAVTPQSNIDYSKIDWDSLETLMIKKDLSVLSQPQRIEYIIRVCQSLGLNPLTKPFDLIEFKGRSGNVLTLYANRNCAEQLRTIFKVNIELGDIKKENGYIKVKATATNGNGRTDEDWGIVAIPSDATPVDIANLELKAITKAKRRVTLSICGLGMLDETEVQDVPHTKVVEPVNQITEKDIRSSMIKEIRKLYKELTIRERELMGNGLAADLGISLTGKKLEDRSDGELDIISNYLNNWTNPELEVEND